MNTNLSSARVELDQLRHSLQALRSSSLSVSAFTQTARSASTLFEVLPVRYREVWLGLLDRLESSALFTEESCSFSQIDLLDSLNLWLDKAQQQLHPSP